MSQNTIHDDVVPLLGDDAGQPRPLAGLYRDATLPERGRTGPWIYANFVTTLDGRISLVDESSSTEGVTASIGDPRDWRLFQELACRADVILSSGRYLRDLAAGTAQDVLPVSTAAGFEDLLRWRAEHGLRPQPDVAVISASLDFPVPESLLAEGRRLTVFTIRDADPEKLQQRESEGARVVRTDDSERVRGRSLAAGLREMGYRRVYCATGPWVFHTLVEDGVLDSLFLTWRHRLVGGRGSSLMSGPELQPPADLQLSWLYRDLSPTSAGQCFARFDVRGEDDG